MAITSERRSSKPRSAGETNQASRAGDIRRTPLLLIGLSLACTGAILTLWLISQAGQRSEVLVVARPIAAGQLIVEDDLRITEVAVDAQVAIVPASQIDQLTGKTARVALLPGSLLSPDAVGTAPALAPGEQLVTLALPLARIPASGLSQGQQILVVAMPGADADPPMSAPASLPATVVRVTLPSEDSALLDVVVVDVSASSVDAAQLAAWSATGRIALVVL